MPEEAAMATRNRCKATTKKGTPCRRKAAPGSAYCRQHQGYGPKAWRDKQSQALQVWENEGGRC